MTDGRKTQVNFNAGLLGACLAHTPSTGSIKLDGRK